MQGSLENQPHRREEMFSENRDGKRIVCIIFGSRRSSIKSRQFGYVILRLGSVFRFWSLVGN